MSSDKVNPLFYSKLESLRKFFSSPSSCISSPSEAKKLQEIIEYLCLQKANMVFKPKGRECCMICLCKISDSSDILPLLHCPCLQSVHNKCLQDQALVITKGNLDERLDLINCKSCLKTIPIYLIEKAFGKEEFRNRKESILIKKKAIIEKEELLSKKKVLQLQQEDRKEKLERERNATFECPICMEKGKIEVSCITLECLHRYCNKCLRNDIVQKIKDNKIKENDISCYICKKPISIFIIKNVLNKPDFIEYERKVISFDNSKIIKKDELIVHCANAKCQNLFIISNKNDIKHHKCELCSLLFCVRGCPKPHQGKTCEQSKREIEREIENEKNNILFNQIRNNERLSVCPKCGAIVQKNGGCNHMTCICGTSYCYVCGNIPGKCH